ncbi:MAG: hypothetical protein HRT67_12635 [Flavobacteriaceae bacterium]|nr:hypothetical protein [Flavobacteriaceae bacterium]
MWLSAKQVFDHNTIAHFRGHKFKTILRIFSSKWYYY